MISTLNRDRLITLTNGTYGTAEGKMNRAQANAAADIGVLDFDERLIEMQAVSVSYYGEVCVRADGPSKS